MTLCPLLYIFTVFISYEMERHLGARPMDYTVRCSYAGFDTIISYESGMNLDYLSHWATHSGLDLPTSTINQENAPRDFPISQSDGDIAV